MEDYDPNLIMRTAICHTPGCENDGYVVETILLPNVMCGACGNTITDVTPAD